MSPPSIEHPFIDLVEDKPIKSLHGLLLMVSISSCTMPPYLGKISKYPLSVKNDK